MTEMKDTARRRRPYHLCFLTTSTLSEPMSTALDNFERGAVQFEEAPHATQQKSRTLRLSGELIVLRACF